MTLALRCACALTLACFVALLEPPPEEALGQEHRLLPPPEPRVASWLANLGHLNKYVEKIFNSSPKKPKNHKKTANATKSTPTATSNPAPPATSKPQNLEPLTLKPKPSPSGSR